MSGPRSHVHPARHALLDIDIRHAKLADGPSIGHEMASCMWHREGGATGGNGKRQQQLIGKVLFDGCA